MNAVSTGPAPEMVVVVLSYNGLADTRKCLASLRPALRPFVMPLLVDNGSTDGTSEAVASEFPWCPIERVEVNRGPLVGNNAGMRRALALGAKWIVLLNNDTTVHPDLCERLRDAAVAHPEYDVLGPVIMFMGDPDVVMTEGTTFNPPIPRGFFLDVHVPLTRTHPPTVVECDIVNGCCLMITAEMVRRVGFFDERFFMYHDESDLCLRVLEAGGRAGVIDHELVWHKGNATSEGTGKKSIRYYDARNLWLLLKKHDWAPRNGRSRWLTRWVYFRYMFHWYCAEVESGNAPAAQAVLQGVYDGLKGVTGVYRPEARRKRMGALRAAFYIGRRVPRWILHALRQG
jgi:GT2 family glycosyltransferase